MRACVAEPILRFLVTVGAKVESMLDHELLETGTMRPMAIQTIIFFKGRMYKIKLQLIGLALMTTQA